MFIALAEAVFGILGALVIAVLLFAAGLGLLVPVVLVVVVMWLVAVGRAARLH
jgi:hypothetical protein